MRVPRAAVLSLCVLAAVPMAAQWVCGTSAENDARLRALHQRARARVAAHAGEHPAVTLREGALYVRNHESLTPGYRPFDLDGTSLVITPVDAATVTMERVPLRYVEPAGEPLRDFQAASTNVAGWHFVTHDLQRSVPFLGRTASRLYLTAFNGIHLDRPPRPLELYFRTLDASVQPVLSPLMLTPFKPSQLHFPRVYVDEREDAVRVTWRSERNEPFGYDLQAELRRDGTIVYSYRSVRALRWGTPVVSAGIDPVTIARSRIGGQEDLANDALTAPAALRGMFDIRRTDVSRLRDADLFAVTVTLGETIDPAKLGPDDVLLVRVTVGAELSLFEIRRDGVAAGPFTRQFPWPEPNAPWGRFSGNTVEVFGLQRDLDGGTLKLRITTSLNTIGRTIDQHDLEIGFPAVERVTGGDISALADARPVSLPIVEEFVLGALDPFTTWETIKSSYGFREGDIDAVAIYQTFFTDLIQYASAYSTGGNPQVDGIAIASADYGTAAPRTTSLLHMNNLMYSFNTAEKSASQVLLHEVGHRWLYFIYIDENGKKTRSLNPQTAHPAAYVHTPAAFPVYGENESSTMGGAFFTAQSDGTYKAYVANHGFSWTDLYLMGLAAPEEVPPWFYIANTNLPKQYWPAQGAIAAGERRDVNIGQVVAGNGPRVPGVATAQKHFRVLFVLLTDSDRDATDAEVAKINELRALLERNFAIATGARGSVSTTYSTSAKRRAARP